MSRTVRAATLTGGLDSLNIRHLSAEELATARLDVAVLNLDSFESVQALLEYRRRVACNVLVVVKREFEDQVLAGLLPGDDVARPDASSVVLASRVERVALAGVTQLDSLTGVLAKSAWLEKLELALRTSTSDRPISVMMMDIDHFKRLNDKHGHLVGDEILRSIAVRLRDHMRWDARIGRIGGEEFALFMTADGPTSMAHAEEIRVAVKSAPLIEGEYATLSIGLVTVTAPVDLAAMLRRADEALYAAKAAGRDRCVHYDDFAREAIEQGGDADMATFENLTRVIAERVAEAITQRGRKVFDALRAEADRDSLTSLYSRRYLDRRLPFEVEHACEGDLPFTIALVDLDNFGRVNKEHGWPTGDRVLRDVSRAIESGVRDEDWVARYGGEEIMLVLNGANEERAGPVLERVRSSVEKIAHEVRGGERIQVTVSIGAATLRPGEKKDAILERASAALQSAKRQGKNRVVQDS